MALAQAKNSTTVRTSSRLTHAQRLVAMGLGAVEAVHPGLAARWAEDLFFTPPAPRLSRQGREFLQTAERGTLRWGGLDLATYTWSTGVAQCRGEQERTVVLLHGWGGRASQMSAFVKPLADEGFRVVALDAPGHGDSQGRRSSIPAFAAALSALASEIGPIHAVVAHSMGGTATALAIRRGLSVGRVAFIGSPSDPLRYVHLFGSTLGLAPDTVRRMLANFEHRLAMRSQDLVVSEYAASLDTPLLLVHDRDDEEVPLWESETTARHWPGAGLLVTQGLGHRKILRDPEVVARVSAFVRG